MYFHISGGAIAFFRLFLDSKKVKDTCFKSLVLKFYSASELLKDLLQHRLLDPTLEFLIQVV